MTMSTMIELFGYLGSAMVVISMLMSSVVKLRVINTLGSVISGTYALIIGSFPLALMNICLVVINVYNLKKLLFTKQEYDLVKCGPGDAGVGYFTRHYREDIRLYFPEFREDAQGLDLAYMVYCDGAPAGILLGKQTAPGTVEAAVEYTTPTYRDCSIGKFLYAALPREGINTLTAVRVSDRHRPYLEKMGYTLRDQSYVRELT